MSDPPSPRSGYGEASPEPASIGSRAEAGRQSTRMTSERVMMKV
jgi:hypothetical protein